MTVSLVYYVSRQDRLPNEKPLCKASYARPAACIACNIVNQDAHPDTHELTYMKHGRTNLGWAVGDQDAGLLQCGDLVRRST